MANGYVLYGARGSGSVAVEAALTLIGLSYELIDDPALQPGDMPVATVNPLSQVPALVLPTGELMTESAAILIWLADSYPAAGLAPRPGDALRPRFLRWMSYISAQIYSLYWIRDVPSRMAADPAAEAVVLEKTRARILDCWAKMEAQVAPAGRFLLGDELTVLDLYLAVVSRWQPRRNAVHAAAPRLGAVARAVDHEPRLASLWAERMPFVDGWDG